jgi:hypothetical protein
VPAELAETRLRDGGTDGDLAMAMHRRAHIAFAVDPDRVTGALAEQLATFATQVTLEIASLQAAAATGRVLVRHARTHDEPRIVRVSSREHELLRFCHRGVNGMLAA